MAADAGSAPPLCTRCKEYDATLDLRSEAVCETCFTAFVASKVIKRLEVLQRDTRGAKLPSRPQRYLLALSRGPSSTALLHILSENVRTQRARGQRVKFELVVVFVDVDEEETTAAAAGGGAAEASTTGGASIPASIEDRVPKPSAPPPPQALDPKADGATGSNSSSMSIADPFTTYFPDITIHTIPLSRILSSPAIDWPSLPPQTPSLPPPQRLADLLSRLPSPSARADVSRLLIRHALFAAAAEYDCAVLLLGYNTTALAELTLCEAAKGRGFGIPWLVNDGAFPLPAALDSAVSTEAPDAGDSSDSTEPSATPLTPSATASTPRNGAGTGTGSIQIYSPLREIFRKEVLSYLSIASSSSSPCGPLIDLFPSLSSSSSSTQNGGQNAPTTRNGARAVVSHRELSLDDVVARYFIDVEASYPSVVANVVRTTGKLSRSAPDAGTGDTSTGTTGVVRPWQCGLCGVGLDPLGDERWKGEIGEEDMGVVDGVESIEGGGGKGRLCYGCGRSVKG
ncbi:hypothetical protein F5Y19DRAFT_132843 [Xylariaceae sp. FL1651]|nr:hypothetical protein F5Y19DRAFT_132843 [Xylariaceae sp. FL1651]